MTDTHPNIHCGGPFRAQDVAVDTCFENKATTLEEMALKRFFRENPAEITGRDILHIGTGDGSLVRQLAETVRQVDSISISRAELEHARERRQDGNVNYHFINKHNVDEFSPLKDRYDVIIDVNLKSYACCETHFSDMIEAFLGMMDATSRLYTTVTGMHYGWNGNTDVSFTPGADTSVLSDNFRVLGIEGLKALCSTYNLDYRWVTIRDIEHYHGTDTARDGPPLIGTEQVIIIRKNS